MEKVMEDLQGILHDLSDLSARTTGGPFQGLVVEGLPFQYRDMGRSVWKITFEPQPPSRNRPEEDTAEGTDEVAQSPTL